MRMRIDLPLPWHVLVVSWLIAFAAYTAEFAVFHLLTPTLVPLWLVPVAGTVLATLTLIRATMNLEERERLEKKASGETVETAEE
jgi:hypothetical protein